ncbi:hypothetical protein GQR58_026696 [Nymphon striatum]|nr:hypothetical protein GQR58_026696 [Nymphon striatum]
MIGMMKNNSIRKYYIKVERLAIAMKDYLVALKDLEEKIIYIKMEKQESQCCKCLGLSPKDIKKIIIKKEVLEKCLNLIIIEGKEVCLRHIIKKYLTKNTIVEKEVLEKCILKENNIRGFSHYCKPQLIKLLKERNLLPMIPIPLKLRRTNPKHVMIENVATGEETKFPSIYQAAKYIGLNPGIIAYWNGRVWAMAKERGLKRYSKLKKDELIELLNQKNDAITSDSYAIIKTFDSYVKPAIIKAMDSYVKPAIVKAMDSYVKPAFKKAMVSYVKPAIKETLDSYIKPAIKNVFDWSKNIINNYFWGKPVPEELEFKESKSALKKFTMQYRIEGKDGYDPTSFLNFVKLKATNLLRNNRGTKVKMILRCNMEKTNIATGDTITDPAAFHSKVEVNLKSTDVNDLYNKKVDNVLESLATFQTRGSNWVFRSIINLDIHTVAYEPLKGNSYIPLPTELEMKKAIINMKNNDDECFKWCVIRAMNPVNVHPERITKDLTEKAELLDWNNIKFPVDLKSIDRFEKQNASISINVFGYENEIYPLRISKYTRENVINLLLISDEDKQHYCLIKNMSRLLASQTSNKKNSRLFCLRCLNSFNTQKALNTHKEYCDTNEAVKIELPEKGTKLYFKNHHKSMRVPFVVYADFESFTEQLDTCQQNPDMSYTKQYQKHTPSGF